MSDPALKGPIAYLTGEYPRATDTFIQREVAGLRKLGIKVHTCSIRQTSTEHLVGDEQRDEASNSFYVLKAARSPIGLLSAHFRQLVHSPARFFSALLLAGRTSAPGLRALLYQLFYFVEAVILADHMRHHKIVHLHNHIAKASCTVAMLASRLSGIPYSFTLHGPDIFYEPIRWRLDAKIADASFVACISDFCRAQAMNFANPNDWSKLHIVHCGVDPSRYVKGSSGNNAKEQNLLFVGRLAAVKGLPVLFSVMGGIRAQYPDLRLTLVGDGPERLMLTRQVQEMGLADCVRFVGYQSQTEVAALLQGADILVLPSFAEGVPVVLMEAMAANVPVIASQIAGIPELIEDGVSGFLTPPGNAQVLQARIETLLADKKLRQKMGQAGREKVIKDFNISTETAWLAKVLTTYSAEGPTLPIRQNGLAANDNSGGVK